jgi:hypothetical protein
MRLGDGEMTLADWLLDPPGPDEVDARGCFGDQAIAEVEARLLEAVQAELETYDEQPAPVTMVPDDRWRLVSSLQKAIRYGMADHAGWVNDQLYALDRKALHRRLGVICVEDVLLGDPMVVAQTLAILGAGPWRQEHGEQRVYRWLARKLAEADGDRSAAELLDSGHSDPRVVWSELNQLSEGDMARIVADPGQPFALRSAVAQLMAGPKFAIGKMPTTPFRSPTPLFRLIAEMGTTRWGCYVAARTAALIRNPMWVEIAIVDRWLREGTRTVVPGPDFPKPMIRSAGGSTLAASLDMHTRPGLMALKRFAKLPSISRILDGVEWEERQDALKLAVFYGEGGVVARRAVYSEESQEVYDWIRLGPEWIRWRPPELAPELIPAIRSSLDELNLIRRQIVGEPFGADVDNSRNEGTR